MSIEDRIKLAIQKGYTYDRETGFVYKPDGGICNNRTGGYIRLKVRVDKKPFEFRAHQFAFYYTYGFVPEVIDHYNRDKADNRIDNLRVVTGQQNQFNRSNTLGYSICKKTGKYKPRIIVGGKKIYLGSFDTPEEATQAYLDAKKIYHKI
jgi:hypothetical protein